MFYIYILFSANTGKYYVGYSEDLWIRVIRHNTTQVTTYTSKFRPWKLAATFEVGTDERIAIRIKWFIKKQHSKNLLVNLIDPEFIPCGVLAQLVRVPHLRD